MTTIASIQQELSTTELLTIEDLTQVKGGAKNDDKRRMRPGGTATTAKGHSDGH